MTNKTYKKRARHADFIGIPRKVANSLAFRYLPPIARALYLDLRRQHNGHNNGQIAAVDHGNKWSPGLRYYGWPHSTIHKYLPLLLAHGLIEKTRQGGIAAMSRTCSLYAFTDEAVIEHQKKGIRGAQASLAYLAFKPVDSSKEGRPQPRGESLSHEPISPSHGLSTVHYLPRKRSAAT